LLIVLCSVAFRLVFKDVFSLGLGFIQVDVFPDIAVCEKVLFELVRNAANDFMRQGSTDSGIVSGGKYTTKLTMPFFLYLLGELQQIGKSFIAQEACLQGNKIKVSSIKCIGCVGG